jgi:xanthine phosphoribosyltransferase
MKLLKERILKDGVITDKNVLKVDSFLNHQMDVNLLNEMAKEFKHRFEGKNINKILTVESSGIGIACISAQHFNCPVVFAKKAESINLDGETYRAPIVSNTNARPYTVLVSKKFVGKDDHILIIDDFLANGCAMMGLIDICHQAGATVEGIGICIEKDYQKGHEQIAKTGIQLESLAVIKKMSKDGIEFAD